MLNHRGGRVIFGIETDGRVIGQQVSDRTLEEVAQEIRGIEPPVFPSIERIAVSEGREVIVVSVGIGHSQPYTHPGQGYRRVGATNQALTREEYNRILLERLHADSRWELQPATGWSVLDLDHEEIRKTLEAGIHIGRIEEPDTRDPESILRGLGLVKQGVLLRASGVRRRGISSTTASFTAMLSTCSRGLGDSFWTTCPSPGDSKKAAWNGWMSRRIPPGVPRSYRQCYMPQGLRERWEFHRCRHV